MCLFYHKTLNLSRHFLKQIQSLWKRGYIKRKEVSARESVAGLGQPPQLRTETESGLSRFPLPIGIEKLMVRILRVELRPLGSRPNMLP